MKHILNFCNILFICLVLTNAVTAMINGFEMIALSHMAFLGLLHFFDTVTMYYPLDNE